MSKILRYLFLISVIGCFYQQAMAQNRIVFGSTTSVYARISGNGFLTIDEQSPNSIVTSSVANIITEGENNVIKWHVTNNTGVYTIPFTTNSLVQIPLQLNIATAGSNNGEIIFSTYETATDKNTSYPIDVTHLNSNCKDSVGLYAVDRFWRIEADNYTTKPTPIINFGYDNLPNEIAITNTITQSALKAQRFNNSINSWETPQKLFGIANPILKTLSNVLVNPTDFFKSWTLIDSSVLVLPVAITSSLNLAICEGTQAVITATGATSYTLMPNNIASISNFSVSPISNTTYSVIGSIGTGSNSCLSYPSSALVVTVSVNTAPSITANVINVNCFGESNGSIATSINAGSAFTYSWSNGSQVGSIYNLPVGIYTLMIVDVNTCQTSKTIAVNQPLPITITELENTVSCDNKPTGSVAVNFTGGVANYTILWNNGNTTASISSIPSGTITATVTDANGCNQIFKTFINEETCLITFIPQLISPNADGKNDLFVINTISYFPNNTLEIYNRWGNLIYTKNKYNNEFDGKANVSNALGNGLLPAGTYFVVFNFGDGVTPRYKSYLEVNY